MDRRAGFVAVAGDEGERKEEKTRVNQIASLFT